MARKKKSATAPAPSHEKRKLSEMLIEMADEFISVGSMVERQNRLAVASNAWNMACASPIVRMRMLDQYMTGYRRYNPTTSDADAANIRKDILTLVERKLKMFPDDGRQIVDAKVIPKGDSFRIEVVSANIPAWTEP